MQISLKNSPLYKLASKSRLAKLLGCRTQFLNTFQNNSSHYIISSRPKPNSEERRSIEAPKKLLKNIHKRLKNMISAIEVPDYLKSVKARGYVDNAKTHLGVDYCIQMDLHHFYQSGRKPFLREMFRSTFKIVDNLAWLLADIATVNSGKECSFFPTGSPSSQILIFWCYKKTFDDIDSYCKKSGIIFTLYVDDMTFSSNNEIPKTFEKFVEKRLENVKLELNPSKTRRCKKGETRVITGCELKNGNKLTVMKEKRCEIVNIFKKTKNDGISKKEIESLLGKISAQQQIEPKFMDFEKQRLLTRQKSLLQTNTGNKS